MAKAVVPQIGRGFGSGLSARSLQEARGRRPSRLLSRGNIMLYGTLLVLAVYYLLPLWVMVVTSLKGMPEIRVGNIFAPPVEVTFEPWAKAWAEACTGLNCDGARTTVIRPRIP